MKFLSKHMVLVVAYVALLVLTAASASIAPLPLGRLGVGIHLVLAFVMAIIIAALFLGIRYLGPLLQVVALTGLLFLLYMWIIMPVDYFTR